MTGARASVFLAHIFANHMDFIIGAIFPVIAWVQRAQLRGHQA